MIIRHPGILADGLAIHAHFPPNLALTDAIGK
jgi:hypothetical protein